MRFGLLPAWLNASPLQRAIYLSIFCCALAAGNTTLSAQIKVISADNLAPFEARDVGTTSDAKTVRIKLNYARAISSIAIAPGYTEFAAGAVSGCVADGHTINPALSACSVEVTFSPQYPGFRTAPLVLTDGAGIKSSIGLQGTGLAPQVALTPGIITTIAGNGIRGFFGDGGPATAAHMNYPIDTVIDREGNVYIADFNNNRVRKVDRNGIITTVAGYGGTHYPGDGSPATSAGLIYPNGLAVDAAGNLYIAEHGAPLVRKVDVNGIITTFAGNGMGGYSGDGGPATEAQLMCPIGMTVDVAQNVYITDQCSAVVRKVDPRGIISTFAGRGNSVGPLGDGGPATEATLVLPVGVAADTAGNIYIADGGAEFSGRVRKVDTQGIITTFAGTGTCCYSGDGGPATQAKLTASGVAVDAAGNVYIADPDNERIRRVDTNGTIKTIAGTGDNQYSGDGGPATKAGFNTLAIAIDSSGSLFLTDGWSRIRKVDVSQSAINFASQKVGTVSPAVGSDSPNHRMVVTNTGNQHMDLGMLNLTGDFSLLSGGDPSYCSSTPDIGPGFSCALPITFAPTDVGTGTGSATVTDNSLNVPGTTQTISLSGTGTNP